MIDKSVHATVGKPHYEVRLKQVAKHQWYVTVHRADGGLGPPEGYAYKWSRERAMKWARKTIANLRQRDAWKANEERIRI